MKISIIIPTYNREKFISRAIKSVLNQSYPDWELIIIDDASIDKTEAEVKNFQKDARIIYKKLPENKGVNYARNRGVEISSGEWISFLDSDDEYLPEALSNIKKAIDRFGDKYQYLNFLIEFRVVEQVKNKGYVNFGKAEYKEPGYDEYVIKADVNGDMHRCFNKSVFGLGFREYINGFEHLFYSNLLKQGIKCLYINQAVSLVHNEDDMSLSNKPFSRWPLPFARGYREFIKKHYRVLKKYPDLIRHYYLRVAKCYLLSGKYFLSFFWILRLIVKQPFGFLKYIVKRKKFILF
jgi:glycosyltransferase involved in cell wall biosynthesis